MDRRLTLRATGRHGRHAAFPVWGRDRTRTARQDKDSEKGQGHGQALIGTPSCLSILGERRDKDKDSETGQGQGLIGTPSCLSSGVRDRTRTRTARQDKDL